MQIFSGFYWLPPAEPPRNPGNGTAHKFPGYDWSELERPKVSFSGHWPESQETGAAVGESGGQSEPETGSNRETWRLSQPVGECFGRGGDGRQQRTVGLGTAPKGVGG